MISDFKIIVFEQVNFLNVLKFFSFLICNGKLFHTFGAAVENAQSRSVFFVMIEGATSTS